MVAQAPAMLESITGFSISDLMKMVPGIGNGSAASGQNGHLAGNVTEAESKPAPVAMPSNEATPAEAVKPAAGEPVASDKAADAEERGKKAADV